ncbi:MAG: PadR family transcriptional regulator [Anaerolineaceae bacterium]|jgi:DNA-binding PadR family transcriptional regulator|nr:PadR family transcriptional regulator [Anaerolineaceae bacterium]
MTEKLPNNSELALLTLLVESPQHGYQLEQMIEGRGLREWTEIGFSSIYYLLNKMQKAGWVTSEVVPEAGKPSRRVYRLTEEGMALTTQAVQQRLAAPRYLSGDFMLGLANQLLIPPAERLAAMQAYRATLAERYAVVNEKWQRARTPVTPATGVVDDLFDHSLKMIAAEMAWLDEWIERNGSIGQNG